ncbi:isocitrate/isopropylmalate family dehydrogenase [Streptomyces sp. NPDC005727]|uniref:isocitrate/isopropylmalate family dehydrogenase n=1 Tax=Streptomyces sp. NPDC005727 TaxID=3157053 RepID=UPI0033C074F0
MRGAAPVSATPGARSPRRVPCRTARTTRPAGPSRGSRPPPAARGPTSWCTSATTSTGRTRRGRTTRRPTPAAPRPPTGPAVVVRENSEGEYAGLGGRNLGGRGPGGEVAAQRALFTEVGCERIMRFAFDLAPTRAHKKVSSVTKSNAQQYGMVLWDDVFKRVAADYPDGRTESVLVDAMSAKFVLKPEDLSVVVASNLNADILSDLGSALAGSLGLAASANLNPERRFPSMFEPVHGSAPNIAGQGLANPIGAVGSAALMLEHFGLSDQAARLHKAIEAATAAGVLTRDVGGSASTEDVTKALIDALNLRGCPR